MYYIHYTTYSQKAYVKNNLKEVRIVHRIHKINNIIHPNLKL